MQRGKGEVSESFRILESQESQAVRGDAARKAAVTPR